MKPMHDEMKGRHPKYKIEAVRTAAGLGELHEITAGSFIILKPRITRTARLREVFV